MELEGERAIPLERARVWAALNDPEVLRACIPGCRELTKTSDSGFSARVTSKIGPVSASFAGTVELSDVVPGEAYTISGTGQGGVAGFAKGGARVTLADDGPAATRLAYTATAEIGGKLASVGSRMLEGAARRTADQFFDAFVRHVGGDGGEEASEAEVAKAAFVPAGDSRAAPGAAAGPPQTVRVQVGDIRIVHQVPGLAMVAVAGWLVALAAILWRAVH